MKRLSRDDLFTLESYASERAAFRQHVLAHKRNRALGIGPNVRLLFEDRLTIQYQVQEMLRIERIFEPAGIDEELSAYNPLIPDGENLKATMLIEFPDADERRQQLGMLTDIEQSTWLQVAGFPPVTAIADEDLDRTDDEKTSSVHFLRFEFTAEMIGALREGAALSAGIGHAHYHHETAPVSPAIAQSLVADFA
ncbi:MAG: DUF3501 family protein [Pseudomonadota bacterium]